MKPLVTVITPLYNYEKYITRCINSVLNQSYEHLEMIIVDDGSTDTGPDIVKNIKDSRVTLIEQKRNGYGVTRAVNRGIQASQGEFICWLSADDYFLPDHIQRKLDCFLASSQINPRVKGVYSDAKVEVIDPDILKTAKISTANLTLSPEAIEKAFETDGSIQWNLGTEAMRRHEHLYKGLFGNPINGCSTLIHRQVYEQLGGFRHSWPLTHDYEMWLRYSLNGFDWGFDDQATSVSRYHKVNTDLYGKDVPQETGLVIRSLAHYLSPHQLFPHPQMDAERFYLGISEILRHHYMLDGSALFIEKAMAHGEHLSVLDKEAYQQAQAFLPNIEVYRKAEPPPGLTLAITKHSCNIRLRALLTECLKMSKSAPIYCWLDPEHKEELKAKTRHIYAEIQAFLGQEISNERLNFNDSDEAESLIHLGGIFLPLGTFEALEQRLIYLYHHLGLVMYHAESERLDQACQIFPNKTQYEKQSLNQALMGIHQPFAAIGHDKIYDGNQEYTFAHIPSHLAVDFLIPNDVNLIKDKTQPEIWVPLQSDLESLGYRVKKMTPFIPGTVLGTPLKPLHEWLGIHFERHFLCVYDPKNQTGWQEVMSQFLKVFQDQNQVCLLIRVPIGHAIDNVENHLTEFLDDHEYQAGIDVVFEQDFDHHRDRFSLMIQSDAILCPFKDHRQNLHLMQEILAYKEVVPCVLSQEEMTVNATSIFDDTKGFVLQERLKNLMSLNRFKKPEEWWGEQLK